jgi:hypothetical protein
MSHLASLLKQRLPIYIWFPIVLACAGLGYIASKVLPVAPVVSKLPFYRTSEMPTSRGDQQTEHQFSRALSPPGDALAIGLPAEDEVHLPTHAPMGVQGEEPAKGIVRGTPTAHASKPSPQPAKAARRERIAKAHRATAQQPTKTPSAPSGGLKNVPIIGSLFSMFQ